MERFQILSELTVYLEKTSCMGKGLTWWIKQDGLGYAEIRNKETPLFHSWSISRAVGQGSCVHYRHQVIQADRGPILKLASRIISSGRRGPSKSWCLSFHLNRYKPLLLKLRFPQQATRTHPSSKGIGKGRRTITLAWEQDYLGASLMTSTPWRKGAPTRYRLLSKHHR